MSASEQTSQNLDLIENRIQALLERLDTLEQENQSLRNRQDSLVAERAGLVQRNEEARSRVELMIERLKSLENAG